MFIRKPHFWHMFFYCGHVDDRTNEIQKSQALKLKNNIDVCWSVSESQVTAPGTDLNIYNDLTTNG